MAEEDDLDIELDNVLGKDDKLGDISLEDVKDSGLDDFLKDVAAADTPENAPLVEDAVDDEKNEVEELSEATSDDFANLKLNDFDTALDSYRAAREGKVSSQISVDNNESDIDDINIESEREFIGDEKGIIEAQPEREFVGNGGEIVEAKAEPEKEAAIKTEPMPEPESEIVSESTEIEAEKLSEPEVNVAKVIDQAAPVSLDNEKPLLMQASTIDDTLFVKNTDEEQQEIMNWYSGSLKDKTYNISFDDMPEFLDSDKTIRVIHVSVYSPYGWNVFFDNGVFMSLRDLKEYQERHGEMPCQEGKIICGNKTCTFERILRVIVYEQPRFFSYKVNK